LWYVQEVEGFRTDVRVVNLSLLSSDWYMRQMLEKVNDADALPINIDPEKFKDGVRDVIYYQDFKIPGYANVQDLLQIMLSDDQNNKAQMQSGEWVNLLPTKNMQLVVDKDAVIKNNVVPKEWEHAIVDTMKWNYSMNYVSRAELSLLAILANNDWKRPVYFTTTTPETNYIGLDKYLVSEGFALKLMPINIDLVVEGEDGQVMDVNSVYDKIMNKYSWGNIANSKYLDPDSYRYLSLYVSGIFGETAQNLIHEGKMQEARNVVNNAYENMPKRTYQMSEPMSYILLVDAMYKTGETAKAREVALRNLQYIKEYMHYYTSNKRNTNLVNERNVRMALVGLQRYKMLADEYKDVEVQKLADELLTKYSYFFGPQ